MSNLIKSPNLAFFGCFPQPKKSHQGPPHPTLPGRWGAASSSEPSEPPAAARLMPFLVQAAEAPSYASVALVKPESTGSHRWTKKEDGGGVVRRGGVLMLVDFGD